VPQDQRVATMLPQALQKESFPFLHKKQISGIKQGVVSSRFCPLIGRLDSGLFTRNFRSFQIGLHRGSGFSSRHPGGQMMETDESDCCRTGPVPV
jgi:hypothetical protein